MKWQAAIGDLVGSCGRDGCGGWWSWPGCGRLVVLSVGCGYTGMVVWRFAGILVSCSSGFLGGWCLLPVLVVSILLGVRCRPFGFVFSSRLPTFSLTDLGDSWICYVKWETQRQVLRLAAGPTIIGVQQLLYVVSCPFPQLPHGGSVSSSSSRLTLQSQFVQQ